MTDDRRQTTDDSPTVSISGIGGLFFQVRGSRGAGPLDQPFMLNFRVDDFDFAVEKLREAGVRIDDQRMEEPYGKFAWVYDPEDN